MVKGELDQAAKLVMVTKKEGTSGVFFATSEAVPDFFLTAVSTSQLWLAIPAALEDLFRRTWQQEVAVIPTDKGNFAHRPWAYRAEALDN